MSISQDRIKQIARQTWIMLLLVESVCGLITGAALVDTLFHLGWGYDWNAVLVGFGIMIWGVFIWWVCRAIFRFTSKVYR